MKYLSMNKKLTIMIRVFALLLAFFVSSIALADGLDRVIEEVSKDYDVEHISNQDFKELSSDKMVVFDVRQLKEYQVSHLEDAIQLDPGMEAEEFFSLHADKLKGKVLVFYCSVGRRSSRLLSKLQEQLPAMGVSQAYNLEGGVFKWSNDNIDFVREGEVTKEVHPYNFYWGRLVKDKDAIKYKVKE